VDSSDFATSRQRHLGSDARRLDVMVETMRRDGTLRMFNARYRAGRAAAQAEGKTFMNYNTAIARLKRADPDADRAASRANAIFR
jgi:hypothetical protein